MKLFFITLLLTMTLSGSLAFILYLLIMFILHEKVPASFRYTILKFCFFLFIVPVPLVKHIFVIWLLSPPKHEVISGFLINTAQTFNLTDGGILFPSFTHFEKLFCIIWFFIFIVIFCSQCIRFIRFRKYLIKNLVPVHDYSEILEQLKLEFHIKRPIKILYSQEYISPFTFGILNPIIVLTASATDTSNLYILRHELQHIKTHDFFYRLLAMLILLLHCFNPLSYLLLKELKEVQEMNCDEKVIKSLSKQDSYAYGASIIHTASISRPLIAPAIFFSKNSKEFLKKRVKAISAPYSIRFSTMVLCFFIICTLSCIPVFAYSPSTYDWRGESSEIQDFDNVTWCEMSFSTDSNDALEIPKDEQYFNIYNNIFVFSDGTIMPVDNDSISSYSSCNHVFKSGTFKKHYLNGKNCTIKIYSAKICTKCSHISNAVLTNTVTYSPCPHK